MSAGEKAQTMSTRHDRRPRPARISQPARIATAIHMIWKYLFMSNSTALTTTTFGTMNSATIQATRNQRVGMPAGGERRDDRQHERDAEVGQVEEGDRRRPVLEPGLAPPSTNRNAPTSPWREIASTMNGVGEDDRRQEEHGVAPDRALAPAAGRQDVQPDDEVGRREGEELERRQQRGQDAGQQDPERTAIRQATTSSTTVTSPGSPRVVARWGRNPVPKIDAILKYGQPSTQVLS